MAGVTNEVKTWADWQVAVCGGTARHLVVLAHTDVRATDRDLSLPEVELGLLTENEAGDVGRKLPRAYLGKGAAAILTGLSTNSSLATVPVTLKCLSKMGVSDTSARLSACIGTILNNDGITLYEAMAALFVAQALGFDLSLGQQVVVVLASLMAGIGIAGIPEAGLVMLPLVLGAMGLPTELVAVAIAFVLPVDWILARARSAVNAVSDMLVAILLDRDPQIQR